MQEHKFYEEFAKFDVVYADLGRKPEGVEGGLRPVVIVSCDRSNHARAPQVTVVPLTKKLKNIPVHVIVYPGDIEGYALKYVSDFVPEDAQTIAKSSIRGKCGRVKVGSAAREKMDLAMLRQFDLMPTARVLFEGNPCA